MEESVFILCKQDEISIERLHICTWSITSNKFLTEYGFEIDRGNLKKLDLLVTLPKIKSTADCKCLYKNISNTDNCQFIFNADIEKTQPINGNPNFGTKFSFSNDRELTILPIGDKLTLKNKNLQITLEIPEQAGNIVYIRFLVKSVEPAFAYIQKGISKKIIHYDVRVNECRNITENVVKAQQSGYKFLPIRRCFCFHIIPSKYNIDFINSNNLKTVRGLESINFNNYLKQLKGDEKIELKEHEYNIIFCKQESKENYSFFSIYSKEYISNSQIILAITTNIVCSLLFAAGGLHTKVQDITSPYWQRVPVEYWIALVLLVCVPFLFHFIGKHKR